MIKYLGHKDINKHKWDECIRNAENGNAFAYSWLLDAVCPPTVGWDALIKGDYETVFPVTWNKKFGIRYLYQPYWIQQLGVFSAHNLSEEIVNEFLETIPSKFSYIDISLNSHNTTRNTDFVIERRVSHYIELINNHEFIYNNYSHGNRYSVKKAKKQKVYINKELQPEKLIKLFKETKGKQLNVKEKYYKRMLKIIQLALEKGVGNIWGAFTSNNELCAVASFVDSNNKIIFLKGATSNEGRSIRAMHYLLDTFFKENAGSAKIFDFAGSMVPTVAEFNKSFGAKEAVYLRLKRNKLPGIVRWLKS